MNQARVTLKDTTVYFPMHLDERARSFRFMLAGLIHPKGKKRRYKFGLHRVNLSARSGDRIGIVGRNGAGKTTLLRTLAGVYEPDRGRLVRIGKTVSLINLSMGMDMYASGIENIRRRSILYGMSNEEIAATIENVGEFSELGQSLHEPIRTYSSGMLARLSFGIATSVRADIILMDEWVSAGDARFIGRAEERMNKFLSDDKIVFLASHSAGLITKWCNKLIVMNDGEIVYFDHDVPAGLAFYRQLLEKPE
jgi:lipopolysaccharide transport system ATP-binding protein